MMNTLAKEIVSRKLAVSFAQARRLIVSGGVKLNGEITTDTNAQVSNEDNIQIGKGKKENDNT